MGCVASKTPVVAASRFQVDWSVESSYSDLALLGGNERRGLSHLLCLQVEDLDRYLEVNVEDPTNMLPKSRRALTIQEIAALARSSLHGISQVVKDHVTKPTAMAQGRVAHLIEWKGWCKPTDAPNALESDFNSYSDLTEGEQEARFAAGVAEQFEIAEAKLRAWSSIDGDESNDDSYDEEYLSANEPPTQSTDLSSYHSYLRDLIHTRVCEARVREAESGVAVDLLPPARLPESLPDTLGSSMCSLDETHPLLHDLSRCGDDLASKLLGSLRSTEDLLLLARLQRAGQRRGHSFSETFEDDNSSFKDCRSMAFHTPEYLGRRKVSDVASSGVVSLDEEDEDAEEEEERDS